MALDMTEMCDQVLKVIPPDGGNKWEWAATADIAEKSGLTVSRTSAALKLLRDDPKSGVVSEQRGRGIRAPYFYAKKPQKETTDAS